MSIEQYAKSFTNRMGKKNHNLFHHFSTWNTESFHHFSTWNTERPMEKTCKIKVASSDLDLSLLVYNLKEVYVIYTVRKWKHIWT